MLINFCSRPSSSTSNVSRGRLNRNKLLPRRNPLRTRTMSRGAVTTPAPTPAPTTTTLKPRSKVRFEHKARPRPARFQPKIRTIPKVEPVFKSEPVQHEEERVVVSQVRANLRICQEKNNHFEISFVQEPHQSVSVSFSTSTSTSDGKFSPVENPLDKKEEVLKRIRKRYSIRKGKKSQST